MNPLSQSQKGIFYACQSLPEGTSYQIPRLYHLPQTIDVERLQKAIDQTLAVHPLCTYGIELSESGEPCWTDAPIYADKAKCAVIRCDKKAFEEHRQTFGRDIDLLNEKLCRFEIYVVESGSEHEFYLFMDVHHVCFDGCSLQILTNTISQIYAGETPNEEQKSAFEIAQDEQLLRDPEGEAWKTAQAWYVKEFGDASEIDSLPIAVTSENEPHAAAYYDYVLDVKAADLQQICEKTGAKQSVIFTAAFGALLANYTADDKSSFCTVYHGRSDKKTRQTVTMMVHTLPVFVRVDNSLKLSEWLHSVAEQIKQVRDFQYYNYQDAAQDLELNNQVMFVYQGKIATGEDDLHIDGQCVPCDDTRKSIPGFAYQAELFEEGDTFKLHVLDDGVHFNKAFLDEMADAYSAILRSMMSAESVADLCACSANQLNWLDQQNEQDKLEVDFSKNFIEHFKAQVAAHPDAECCVAGSTRLTYRQIDELSDDLAQKIHAITPAKTVVSYTVERDEYMLIVPLAVRKAQCVCQPLDSSYPADRLDFMKRDADSALLLTVKDKQCHFEKLGGKETNDAAVLLYTSGSTGVPKGVMIGDSNLVAISTWHAQDLGLGVGSRYASYASYGFDAYFNDMCGCMTAGACLHIIGEDIRFDLDAIHQYVEREGITHLFMTTQVGTQMAINYPESNNLKWLGVGGEKLVSLDPPKYRLWNGYGPTEGTVYCSYYYVNKNEPNIPIGHATPNYKLFVVNKNLQRVPMGAAGELLISGSQVSLGYLKQPEKTAAAFIEWNGMRVYRTGDVVRYRQDGELEFIGRRDGQVKIRGFRIELKEVEAVIRDYPAIKDVTVQAFDLEAGGKAIAAYIVSDEKVDIQALNQFVAEQKPPYMVPAVTIQIDAIPLNVNQKVDKKKLPSPVDYLNQDDDDVVDKVEYNKLELELLELIGSVIGVNKVSLSKPLIYYGLSSITALKLVVQLHKRYNVSPDMHTFAKTATLQSIENMVLDQLLRGNKTETITAETITTEQSCVTVNPEKLTYQQFGVYSDSMRHPQELQYNIPMMLTMPANVTADQLKTAVKQVLAAHNFEPKNIERKTVTPAELDELKRTFVQPFDLSQGTPYRVCIAEQADKVYLFIDFHHVIFDGASYDIFLTQLVDVLSGKTIEKENYTYSQYAENQHKNEGGETFVNAQQFFAKQMQTYESAQHLIPDLEPSQNAPREVCLKKKVSASIADFCKRHAISQASFYLSATYLACHAFSGNKDVHICTISNGRSDLRTADTFGMFVNTLPLVGHVSDCSVADFLTQSDVDFQNTLKNENYPFSRIASDFGYQPQVIMVNEVGVIANYLVNGQPIEKESLELKTPKFPLCVLIDGVENDEYINLLYDDTLFSPALMQSFADTLDNIVGQLLTVEHLRDIRFVNDAQVAQLDGFNHYTSLYNDDTIVSMFRRQVEKTPDNTAVVFEDLRYSYRETDFITEAVATKIVENLPAEAKGENVVSILIPRSEWMVLASLAALKAGCAYEPLDSSYPAERLNFMAKDADSRLLITSRDLRPILSEFTGPVLYIEDLTVENLKKVTLKPLPQDIKPTSLFTLLYTSGSTGTPKGVMIEHRNLVSICRWSHIYYGVDENSVAGASASYGFDPNMMDMYPQLTCGGTVCIVPEPVRRDLEQMKDYFERNHVTHTTMSTQIGVILAKNYPNIKYLRYMSVGGEKMPTINLPSYKFYNCYGPTECTIECTAYPIEKAEANIPIGHPMENAHLYITDEYQRRLPVGAIGELLIGGDGVGRGYLNLPERTAQSFINWEGKRVYRTGDVVRWRNDGMIEFVGRRDGQVKIRGFRIELKEVEAVIRDYPAIKDVTVQAFDDAQGGKFIAAYVVSNEKIDTIALGHFIAEQKPPYMVPACIMQIDAIPLNVNQKVDKKKLPAPVCTSTNEYVAPQGKVEEALCAIFADVLGVERLGATDNFFDMGGTSLVVTQVIMSAQKQGISITYADVFAYPTARELALTVDTATNEATDDDADLQNFDYAKIDELLTHNNLENYLHKESRELGDILLLGATGYLGIHILYELLNAYPESKIYCLLRPKKGISAAERLRQLAFYYFEQNFQDLFDNRIVVIEGDVSQPLAIDYHVDTVINCAAIVKHFAKGNEIKDFNVGSVQRCVDFCVRTGARLIHISTISVAGMSVDDKLAKHAFTEQELWIGQSAHNQYIHSKFMGERIILDAISKRGLDAKIMRVGNLSARAKDGEFQANSATNTFMGRMRVYNMLGAFPYDNYEIPTEFSPIDELAKSICLLAQTPKECCLFHPFNNHMQLLGDVVERLKIRFVEMSEFAELIQAAGQDAEKAQKMSALLAYQNKESEHKIEPIQATNTYTIQVLLRMGFRWSKVSSDYVDQFVKCLAELGFFDN